MQAISYRSEIFKPAGQYFDTRLVYKWNSPVSWLKNGNSAGNFAISFQGASQEYLGTYFAVPRQYVTSNRPFYSAKSGYLTTEISILQAYTSAKPVALLTTIESQSQRSLFESDKDCSPYWSEQGTGT